MIKGTNKRTVLLKCDENSSFENVFFVLKNDRTSAKKEDILNEAKRMVYDSEKGKNKVFFSYYSLCFVLGFAVGSAVCVALIFLLTK